MTRSACPKGETSAEAKGVAFDIEDFVAEAVPQVPVTVVLDAGPGGGGFRRFGEVADGFRNTLNPENRGEPPVGVRGDGVRLLNELADDWRAGLGFRPIAPCDGGAAFGVGDEVGEPGLKNQLRGPDSNQGRGLCLLRARRSSFPVSFGFEVFGGPGGADRFGGSLFRIQPELVTEIGWNSGVPDVEAGLVSP